MPSAKAVGGERGRGRLFSLASTRHYRLRMTSIVIGTGGSQLARAHWPFGKIDRTASLKCATMQRPEHRAQEPIKRADCLIANCHSLTFTPFPVHTKKLVFICERTLNFTF